MKKQSLTSQLLIYLLLILNLAAIIISFLLFNRMEETVDDKFYNIELSFKNPHPKYPIPSNSFKAFFSIPTKWDFQQNFMYSDLKKDHNYKNSNLEIEFVREIPTDFESKPGFCRLAIRDKVLAIFWINKSSGEQYSKGFKPISGYGYPYVSDIGKFTEIIFSNISKKVIKKMYPNFKGHYRHIHIKKIIIDENYPIDSRDFYNHIEFDNFRFGLDYRDIKDGSVKILP